MEACFTRWLRVGHDYARWSGLCPVASEDCAAEFVAHMLQIDRRQRERKTNIANAHAWEQTCARRFALNYRRNERRHEPGCDWRKLMDSENTDMTPVCSCRPEEPVDAAIRRDLRRRLLRLVNALPECQRDVFVRHHVNDESIQEIADALHKTTGAIEQTLWRARQRLRASLQAQEDADDACLSAPPPPRMAGDKRIAGRRKYFAKYLRCPVRLREYYVSFRL